MSSLKDVEMMDTDMQDEDREPSTTDSPGSLSSTKANAATSNREDSMASPSSTASNAATSDGEESTASPSSTRANAATSDRDDSISVFSAEDLLIPETSDAETPVKIKMAEPLKHRSPTEAYHCLMSGRLVPKYGGRLVIFNQDASGPHQGRLKGDPRPSPLMDLRFETPARLERAKRYLLGNSSAIPRFLFRGWHIMSGGGHDTRLNSWYGIMPHGFLDGETPTSMWNVPDIYEEVSDHLSYIPTEDTHFSSWTQMITTALIFAAQGLFSTIAVLDTESFVDHVWLSDDLYASGLCGESYSNEYLIYGPIRGPNYHCVPANELLRTTRVEDILLGPIDVFGNDRISLCIEREAVNASRKIATFLQPRDASSDKILILTARFVAVRAARFLRVLDYLRYPDIAGFLYCARDDLQDLAMRSDARYISLAVPDMSTEYSQALTSEVQLLMAAENAVHVLGWTSKAAISTWLSMDKDDVRYNRRH